MPTPTSPAATRSSSIQSDVDAIAWYHTIDLPGGVTTPGYVDLRPMRPKVPIPDLTGKRCLDVGSATGYWAFEMERAGAAEVVSFDLDDKDQEDWAVGVKVANEHPADVTVRGFKTAKHHLDSSVHRVDGSVYDLSPGLLGRFDFVFIGNLLLHLRDPIGALMAVRSVCDGPLLSLDVVSPVLSAVHPRQPMYGMWRTQWQQWYLPNRAGRRQQLELAGFRVADRGPILHQKMGEGFLPYRTPLRRIRSPRTMAGALYNRYGGIPTDWYLAN